MKKKFFCLFLLLFVSLSGNGSEDAPESLVPASVSIFMRTEPTGAFVTDLKKIFSALPEEQAGRFLNAGKNSGMDVLSADVLKNAGIDLKRRAGLGFSEAVNVFVMLPVTDPDRTARSFMQWILKMDSSGKADLFPAPGRFREVQVTQMGKDIFFFSMKGYFFICSAPSGVREIIDCILDKKQVLSERTDYRKFLVNCCSPEDAASLFADKSFIDGMLSDQQEKADLSAEYLGAGIKFMNGKLSCFAGMDFGRENSGMESVSASGTDLSGIFRTGEAGRALFSPDMDSCMFLSIDPALFVKKLDSIPEIRKSAEELEQELEKKTGLSLKRELIPACSGNISLFRKKDRQDSGMFISMKRGDSGEELYSRMKAFLNRHGQNTEDPLLIKDEQAGTYFSFTEKGLFAADSQEMLAQLMACGEKSSGPEKYLKKDLSNVWGFVWVNGRQMSSLTGGDFLLLLKKHGSFVFAEAESNLYPAE